MGVVGDYAIDIGAFQFDLTDLDESGHYLYPAVLAYVSLRSFSFLLASLSCPTQVE